MKPPVVLFAAAILAPALAAPALAGDAACKKRLVATGIPDKIESVAGLSALKAWSETARSFGPGYAMWHNASDKAIQCRKTGDLGVYVCSASGKPCQSNTLADTDKDRPADTGRAAAAGLDLLTRP